MAGRTVVDADGRRKAYRPLPDEARAAALAAGLAAYERGDFFEAHEQLEPAWMGTDVAADRAFVQGLIKLAAAYVHGVRGNPAGIAKNLAGARIRLAEAGAGRGVSGAGRGVSGVADTVAVSEAIDLGALIDDIDQRLSDLEAHPDGPTLGPPNLHRMSQRSPA